MASQRPHVRNGLGAVRPYIHGPMSLLGFLRDVLGAVELERHDFGPDSAHVALRIGDSVIVVEAGDLPPDVSGWTGAIYVYVEDVDAVYERAIDLGADPIAEPEAKPYGERQAGFRDSGDNTWWVATYKE